MAYITNLYKAVSDQDEIMLCELLYSPGVVYDIDREYEEFWDRPLLYGHLTRRGEIPSAAITKILIDEGANVNYHRINPRCCSICDALPDHDYEYPEDRYDIKKWDGKYSSGSIESLYDNMRLLVHAGADVNALGDHRNALMQAASDDDVPAAKFLLKNGADVALCDADGISALFNASNPNSSMSEQVDPAMIRLLFDFGADPDTRFDGKSCGAMCAGYDGCSAMFKAARIYYADCKFLAMKTAGLRDPDARRVLTARIHCIETTQGAELEEYEEYNRKRRDYGACWSDEESGDGEE